MKRVFLIGAAFTWCCIAGAQVPENWWGIASEGAAAGGPFFSETFEGSNSGYDNAGWAESGSPAPDPNYTITVLQGAQSLFITNGASDTSPNFTAQSTIWIYFRVFFTNALDNINFLLLRDGSGTIMGKLGLSSGRFDVYNGTSDDVTTATVTANTLYYCCVRYSLGTGANGISSTEFATTTTQSGSGTAFKQITNGTSTGQIASIRFVSSINMGLVIDQIKLFSSSQGVMQ